ncbi:MAG: EAL domain-containing protein [Oscillospiraceae bacterium]
MAEKKQHHGSFLAWLAARRLFVVTAAVLLALGVAFVVAGFRYYANLQDTISAESTDYLEEISRQIGINAGNVIEDNFAILGTVSTVLKTAHADTFVQVRDIMQEQKQHWNFEKIFLVDAKGVAYDAAGHGVLLKSDSYLRETIVERHRAMSTSQMLDDTECVVFAVPLDGVTIEGIPMSVMLGTYDLATFDRILSITAFSDQGYGHIVRSDGTVVIRSSSPAAPATGYNILTSLAAAPSQDAQTVDKVREEMKAGRAGQVELSLSGEPLLMVYTPLGTQEWFLLTFVPVAVATEKARMFLDSTLLIGALVALSFSILIAVLLLSSYRHKHKLEQLAFVDPVTGGNTIQRFYTKAAQMLDDGHDTQYALVYTNIGKFKLLNEQLGRPTCDAILTHISKSIRADLGPHECSGRVFGDNFCVLLQYENEEELARRLNCWTENYADILEKTGGAWLPFTVEIGVYVVEDSTMPVEDMMDRAKLALRESGGNANTQVQYHLYDEQVRRRLLREKQLEDMMAPALENHEFEVYLQPKYRTGSETIGGAEALVRWNSATEGMIYPDEFISIFEKNGSITRVDLWVFEQVCKTLREWLDAGHQPMRISVNCSRVHLKMPDFLDRYRAIAERYAVPPELLEIELTENVVFEDVVHLTKIIEDIHKLGFSCSMDDFGSGYSSLNLIQDIPVDVLKLDKIFFRRGTRNLARTESVVGSIVSMARALSMETVAEGVEERAQVDMLKKLGCDYIQGYYFARPMPIHDFEKLAFQTP